MVLSSLDLVFYQHYVKAQKNTYNMSSMSNTLALGQTRNLGSRSNSGGREEVAGGGAGEVLEEGRRAHSLATAQAWRSYRTGFGKLD